MHKYFCTMSHRGEVVKKEVKRSGIAISKLAYAMKVSRETVYNYFRNADLRFDIIDKIGKIIKYDFSDDFTDMPIVVSEPEGPVYNINKIMSGEDCLSKYAALWDRYTKLLEDYKELSDKNRILEHKYK